MKMQQRLQELEPLADLLKVTFVPPPPPPNFLRRKLINDCLTGPGLNFYHLHRL